GSGNGEGYGPGMVERLFGRLDANHRRCIGIDLFAVPAACGAIAVDHPHWIQGTGDLFGSSMRGQEPDQLLVAEILRHDYPEDVFVAADLEVSGLAAIASRFEAIVRPEGNIEDLFVVAVHVAEPHVEGTIRVGVKPLIDGGDGLAGPVAELDLLRVERRRE